MSRQPSRLVFVEIQWTTEFDQEARVVLDIHHCVFRLHWRKANRLVFGGQSDRACFHRVYSYRFRCHGKHGFCSFREGNKHLHLQGFLHSNPQSIYHDSSFHRRAPGGSMTHLRLVLHFRCELRFMRSFWWTDNEFTLCSRRQTSRDSALTS